MQKAEKDYLAGGIYDQWLKDKLLFKNYIVIKVLKVKKY